MPAYSASFAAAVLVTPERSLGQELAVLCVSARLPAAYVAQVLGVTRMTLHTWFRGGVIRERKRGKVSTFMRLLQEDLDRGVLPAKTVREARDYLQVMCEEPIVSVAKLRG